MQKSKRLPRKDLIAQVKKIKGTKNLGPTPCGHRLWTFKDLEQAIKKAGNRSDLMARAVETQHKADTLKGRVKATRTRTRVPKAAHPALQREADLEAALARYNGTEKLSERHEIYSEVKHLLHSCTAIKRDADAVRKSESDAKAAEAAQAICEEFAGMEPGPERSAFYHQHRDVLAG